MIMLDTTLRIGYAFTGSFCTFEEALVPLRILAKTNAQITPIFSFSTASFDTRFFKAQDFRKVVEEITGNPALSTIEQVEPIGPKRLLDILVVAPCTGNTLAKIANGVIDTPVVMACKSHLRNARPVVLAISTNDGLSAGAQNIGKLQNTKHIFFVPYGQDDPQNKPCSLVAKFDLLLPTMEEALKEKQIQPLLV